MIRICDGTDPNLTRDVLEIEFDPETMTVSPWNDSNTPAMCVTINCQCGLIFDDAYRLVIYPHEEL